MRRRGPCFEIHTFRNHVQIISCFDPIDPKASNVFGSLGGRLLRSRWPRLAQIMSMGIEFPMRVYCAVCQEGLPELREGAGRILFLVIANITLEPSTTQLCTNSETLASWQAPRPSKTGYTVGVRRMSRPWYACGRMAVQARKDAKRPSSTWEAAGSRCVPAALAPLADLQMQVPFKAVS